MLKSKLRKSGLICFLVLLFSLPASAPGWKSLTIYEPSPVEPFRRLVFAIGMVETEGDTLAYNPFEEATGILQIRPIRLLDYNRRTGNNYTTDDLFDYKTSVEIFLYFADQIGPYNLELIARKWNGSGRLTFAYWDRIKQYL
jgi:hypothetical protein